MFDIRKIIEIKMASKIPLLGQKKRFFFFLIIQNTSRILLAVMAGRVAQEVERQTMNPFFL